MPKRRGYVHRNYGPPQAQSAFVAVFHSQYPDLVLMVHHGPVYLEGDRPRQPKWSLPGGGLDPKDKSIVHAAEREFKEETGLLLASLRLIGRFTPRQSDGLVFLFRGYLDENLELGPFQPDDLREVDEVRHVHLLDIIEKPEEVYPAQSRLIAWAKEYPPIDPLTRTTDLPDPIVDFLSEPFRNGGPPDLRTLLSNGHTHHSGTF